MLFRKSFKAHSIQSYQLSKRVSFDTILNNYCEMLLKFWLLQNGRNQDILFNYNCLNKPLEKSSSNLCHIWTDTRVLHLHRVNKDSVVPERSSMLASLRTRTSAYWFWGYTRALDNRTQILPRNEFVLAKHWTVRSHQAFAFPTSSKWSKPKLIHPCFCSSSQKVDA